MPPSAPHVFGVSLTDRLSCYSKSAFDANQHQSCLRRAPEMLQEEVVLGVFYSFHFLVLAADIAVGHIYTPIPSLNRAKVSP